MTIMDRRQGKWTKLFSFSHRGFGERKGRVEKGKTGRGENLNSEDWALKLGLVADCLGFRLIGY